MKRVIFSLSTLALAIGSVQVQAHGTFFDPMSRVYFCATRTNILDSSLHGNAENPQDAACAEVKERQGTLAFYDPYAQAQASANSRHQEAVPNGTLCSGHAAWYTAFDMVRDDWSTSPMQAGEHRFRFMATAPHSTKDWVFYITKPGYANEALTWEHLEPFCTVGNIPTTENAAYLEPLYEMDCTIPNRYGKHIIYNTWQRSDSGEAFYTCMDVMFPQQGSSWIPVDNLHVRDRLERGQRVEFRHLNAQGQLIDSVALTITLDNRQPGRWARDLADLVNSQMSAVRLGEELPQGGFATQQSDWGNLVYFQNTTDRFELNFLEADPNAPTPTNPPTNGGCAAQWQATETYTQDMVVWYDGIEYRAKYWTQGNNPARENGQGHPWEIVAECQPGNVSNPTPSPSPSPIVVPSPSPSPSPIVIPSPSPSPSPIVIPSPSPSPSPIVIPSPSPSPSPIVVPSPSPSPSPIVVPSPSPSPSPIVVDPPRTGSQSGWLLLLLPLLALKRRK